MAQVLEQLIPHSANNKHIRNTIAFRPGKETKPTIHPIHYHYSAPHKRGNRRNFEWQHTLAGHFGKADLKSGREVTPGQVSSVGVPSNLHVSMLSGKPIKPFIKLFMTQTINVRIKDKSPMKKNREHHVQWT